jgi:CubicO group peptidase (beta-lactamase class C family)
MKQLTGVDDALRAAADTGEVPGVVAMAATGDEIIYQAAFGKRALGASTAMTPDSVFWIASMTKAITGAAAPEGRSAGGHAWAGLANTYFWIDPARDVAGVIMMQLLPFIDTEATKLCSAFERGVYASLGDTKAAA